MKKITIAVLALLSLFVVSCKKDAPSAPVDPIVRTDDPPEQMFPENQYARTSQLYIEKTDIDNYSKKGYGCFWDRYTNERGDCMDWYTVSAKKYWGVYQGKVYISKSKDWYVLQEGTVLDAQQAVRDKGAAIGHLCIPCDHPFSDYRWLNWIEQ